MFKLLIIEDEPVERETLKLMLDNNCGEMFQIETAENGFKALERAEKWLPDIAMVDINMPGMNGLDTIRALKKKNAQMRFLILSSYNRFEYAQEAVKLGVEDFILKPAKVGTLKAALEAAAEKLEMVKKDREDNSFLQQKIEEVRPLVESECIYALIGEKTEKEIKSSMDFLGYEVKSGFCFVIEFKDRPRFILYKVRQALTEVGLKCLGEQFHNIIVFFVLSEKELEERKTREVGNFVTMLLKETGIKGTRVGVGQMERDLYNFYLSYRQALAVMKQREEPWKKSIYLHDKENDRNEKELSYHIIENLVEALKKTDEEAMRNSLKQMCTEFIMKTEVLSYARNQIYRILLIVLEQIKKNDISFENIFEPPFSLEEVLEVTNRKELELYAALWLNHLMQAMYKYKKINNHFLIEQALQYIEEHYGENIMLDDIASYLEVSSFYLSKLFKKATGRNFTDLLAEKRVEKAKTLLRSQMSVKEITFAVGFNSQNYFTKVFKKYCGITPTEYKNKTEE